MSRTADELIRVGHRHNSPSYAPADIVFDHGEGVWLYDTEGNEYLDFAAGIAVNCLGHGHPKLTETIQGQAERLLHVSNLYYTAEQIELMELLCKQSLADRVFLCNSGAEANEAAIKLARRYQKVVAGQPERTEVVTMNASFHGRTMGAITATGQPKYHEGYEPMVPGFRYADFNDLEAVADAVGEETAAVMVEPIQGEGGVRPARPEFLQGLRDLCDEHGALLIFDEVQTGVGRIGELFAYRDYGVEPDIFTLAKGLGGGTPIGAMLSTEEIFKGWKRGSHASTFGGNPLVCSAAKVVLEEIEKEGFLENVRRRGDQIRAGLERLAERFEVITDVRGRGLLVGAECGEAAKSIARACRDRGLLITTAGGDTLRLVPPLVVAEAEVEEALERLQVALEGVAGDE
ncbi:MAG: aspartate aminotransferase family protein [Persicimonas sp.]